MPLDFTPLAPIRETRFASLGLVGLSFAIQIESLRILTPFVRHFVAGFNTRGLKKLSLGSIRRFVWVILIYLYNQEYIVHRFSISYSYILAATVE